MYKFLFLVISNICFIFFITNAAEPIVIDYADELIGETSSGASTRRLVGNVQLHQGDVRATCGSAVQYMFLNKFQMSQNVVIRQNTLTLKAPLVVYDGNIYLAEAENGVTVSDNNMTLKASRGNFSTKTQVANFIGKVVLVDDSVSIFCDTITHNCLTRDSKAIGSALIKSKLTNAFLIADSIFNFHETNYSIAYGNPVLCQIDTNKSTVDDISIDSNQVLDNNLKFDTLTIRADTMEAFRAGDDEFYHFRGNVEIIKGEISAKCGEGYYYKIRQYFVLRNNPVIWHDNMQLHADSITIFTAENTLRRIHSLKNALSITWNDTNNLSRKNQLYGNEIDILFSNSSPDIISSNGDAKSIYFLETDGAPDGVIKNSAEKIIIKLLDSQAENITLVNQIPGEYTPEPLVLEDEQKFFLSGYKFYDNKPKKFEISLDKYLNLR